MARRLARGALALLLTAGCGGGGGGSPQAPSASPTPAPPSTATVTIAASEAVDRPEVTVAPGQAVTFVNQGRVAHEMVSDPHPLHTECPPMNAVGVLLPGQSRTTAAFPTARTCGYHDHGDAENPGLRGRIVIR